MDAATATPPTDFVPRAAHVQLAGDLDTEATPVKVKGTWAYARSTAMGAKGVELPFSYERTRAATPAEKTSEDDFDPLALANRVRDPVCVRRLFYFRGASMAYELYEAVAARRLNR